MIDSPLRTPDHPLNPDPIPDEDGSVEIVLAELDDAGKPYEAHDSDDPDDFNTNLALHIADGDLSRLTSDLIEDYENDLASRKEWESSFADGIKLLGLQYEERTEPWAGACGLYSPILTEAVVRFQAETATEMLPASGPVKTALIGRKTQAKEDSAQRVQDDMNWTLTEKMPEFRPEAEKMLFNLPITGCAFKKVMYDPSMRRPTDVFVPAEDIVIPYGVSEILSTPRLTHRMFKTKNEIVKLQAAGFYDPDVDLGDPVRDLEDIRDAKDRETGVNSTFNDDRYKLLEMQVELDPEEYGIPAAPRTAPPSTIKFLGKTPPPDAIKAITAAATSTAANDDEPPPRGVALPFIVTILHDNQRILSIRRNWEPDDPTRQKRHHVVQYNYIPGFGAYGFGLIHLIGNAARGATSIIRQLVDCGTLANLPGGLKSRGLRIKGEDTPISPGEWRDVDVASGSVRDNIMALPYKEPSQTLLALLNQIVEEARRFAATADMKISDMSAQAPVGTTLALLERQLKIMSAVQARTHYSFKQELKLLAAIIRDYTPANYTYEPDTEPKQGAHAKRADYSTTEIVPVSDPNASTMAQRVVAYQAALQLSQGAPQIYNLPKLHRQMLNVLGIKNAEQIVPMPEDKKPQDPATENMNVLRQRPLKAFAYQDHDAHNAVHQAFMQDPKTAAAVGQNPAAQMMMATLQAHIAEHAAFAYRLQVEKALGVPLPAFDEDEDAPISPEDEKDLASLIAQAAQRTLIENQASAAQQAQAAQQQQQEQANQAAAASPEFQLKQQELSIKQAELQRKEQESQRDFQIERDRIALERQRLFQDASIMQSKLVQQDREHVIDTQVELIKAKAKAQPKPTPFPGRPQ